jgi:hypothetical protein
MRVFIPKGKTQHFISNEITSENAYCAYYGFSTLGWEVVFYEGNPPEGLFRSDVVVGWISQVRMALENLGITVPNEIDYPEEIRHYLGRKVWNSNLHKIYTDPTTWPVFVKPVKGKQFNGTLVESLKDMVGLGSQENRDIWCSEPVKFISEWRCYVRYGQLLDCRRYKGDMQKVPNFYTIRSCIAEYTSQPAGYGIDFGVTETGETLLIEANDGYAMGSYGLHCLDYAKLISARWHEMVNLPDPCQF